MDLARIADDLRARREELAAELGVVTTVERDPDASVSFGKRIGDGTTEAVERLNRVGTARELGAMLEDVDRALVKLEDGTYGICDRCGRLIPEARLDARPWSALCVTCASLRSRTA
ncbi:MAG TPA: TraR/DksA C4-type zinc finger protein [Actinomycetota bacterium]|nr:TraR/DksA C4-type zinc finger protein [Actinomycetota bacterium]